MPSLFRTAIVWAWLGILLPGCSTTLYSWGHYEERIYASYVSPGTTSLEAQAAELDRDLRAIWNAVAPGKPFPLPTSGG